MTRTHLLSAFALASVLYGCGGSTDYTTVEVASFQTESERKSIAGDWPKPAYTIFDRQSWEAAWAERRAALDCTRTENTDACAQVIAPEVDFSTSTLVGTTLGRNFAFPSSGKQASAHKEGDVLTVEFAWEHLATPIPANRPASTQFWIVRAKAGTVVVKPAGAA